MSLSEEEGIDFTNSSHDDELLDYLVPGSQKKSVLNQENIKKLVLQKQDNAKRLSAQKETQRKARKTSNIAVMPVEVHQVQGDQIGPPRPVGAIPSGPEPPCMDRLEIAAGGPMGGLLAPPIMRGD